MIRTIFSIALVFTLTMASSQAEPKSSKKSNSQRNTQTSTSKVPAAPLVSGWTYSNGSWTHVDGYRLVNGKVVRSGIQTHKKVPNPPTKAELDAVVKKPQPLKTPAQIAAEKEAQRQRNLAPRMAPQTGSHL